MQIKQDEDVLIVVDMQVDFVSGSLAITGGKDIIQPINRLARLFEHVIVTKDWHPPEHVSFYTYHPSLEKIAFPGYQGFIETSYGQQFVANPHCVRGTPGAELDPDLELTKAELVFFKGYKSDVDSFSAFHMNDGTPTGLAELLRVRGFKRVFGVGLARYGCVGSTLKGAAKEGFTAFLLEDASAHSWGSRATTPEQVRALDEEARRDLANAGVAIITSQAVL